MPIASKFHGTYTISVSGWSGPSASNPGGTLVVPSPNNTDQVQYTISGASAVDVTPTFSSDNISFAVSSNTFTASSWVSGTGWSGTVSNPNNVSAVQSGNWNSNKQMLAEGHKREVA